MEDLSDFLCIIPLLFDVLCYKEGGFDNKISIILDKTKEENVRKVVEVRNKIYLIFSFLNVGVAFCYAASPLSILLSVFYTRKHTFLMSVAECLEMMGVTLYFFTEFVKRFVRYLIKACLVLYIIKKDNKCD